MNGNMLSKQAWPLLPSGQIAIVVVLLREVRIRRELIALVDHRPASRPVPHRIIGKGLRVKQQGMAGAGESIQLIVAERLIPSAVRQTRPIADRVIDVVGLIDGHTGGRELMQDIGHLTGGIVAEAHCRFKQLRLWRPSRTDKVEGITME